MFVELGRVEEVVNVVSFRRTILFEGGTMVDMLDAAVLGGEGVAVGGGIVLDCMPGEFERVSWHGVGGGRSASSYCITAMARSAATSDTKTPSRRRIWRMKDCTCRRRSGSRQRLATK